MIETIDFEAGETGKGYSKSQHFNASLFADAWKAVNKDSRSMESTGVIVILEELERRLNIKGSFLSNDVVIRSRIQSAVERLGIPGGDGQIALLKQDVFVTIVSALSDVKIIDYRENKVYGNFNDRHAIYQDDSGNMVYKAEGCSLSEDSDMDEADSLMEAGSSQSYGRSPSSIMDFERENETPIPLSGTGKQPSHKGDISYNICELISEIEKYHHTIDLQFNSYDFQLKNLKAQNENDLTNLHLLSNNNQKVEEKMFGLNLEIQNLHRELYNLREIPTNTPVVEKTLPNVPSRSIASMVQGEIVERETENIAKVATLRPEPNTFLSIMTVLIAVLIYCLIG